VFDAIGKDIGSFEWSTFYVEGYEYEDEQFVQPTYALGDRGRLRWRHARKSIAACRKPVFLDVGNGAILFITNIKIGGYGREKSWYSMGAEYTSTPWEPGQFTFDYEVVGQTWLVDKILNDQRKS
jgi:hypothetical protein